VDVRGPDVAGLLERLRARSSVREATIFGEAIHALADAGDSFADLQDEGIVIRPTGANLEDVFVTLSRAVKNGP
jgi:ABC-2 type transport system ATP-binding protein